jgi:hypothetical protein
MLQRDHLSQKHVCATVTDNYSVAQPGNTNANSDNSGRQVAAQTNCSQYVTVYPTTGRVLGVLYRPKTTFQKLNAYILG